MPSDKQTQTTVRLEDDLLKALKDWCYKTGLSQTEAIHRGLRMVLADDAPPREPCPLESLTPADAKLVRNYIDILREPAPPKGDVRTPILAAVADLLRALLKLRTEA